jgi:probable blue pigment (indigoidine) exporter
MPEAGISLALLAGMAIPIVVGGSVRLGRYLALDARRVFGGPLGLTALAMTVGGFTTLALAVFVEGVPTFSLRAWLLIIWLAAINTALTYTLWTQTQRTLRAVESSVLADLTVFLIALLGWVVLGEALGPAQIAGLLLAVAGVFLVQLAPVLRGRGSAGATPQAPLG